MDNTAEGPIPSYHELALYIGIAVPVLLLAASLFHFFMLSSPLRTASKPVLLVVPQLAGYGAAFLVLVAMVKMRGQSVAEGLRWRLPSGALTISIALGMVMAILSVILAVLLRTPNVPSPMLEFMTEDPVTMGLAAVLMAPVTEEVFFRGVLQPLLVRDAGRAGIVLAALPFALLHGPEYAWSWQHVLLIGLAGVSFGLIRHQIGSTGAAAVAHATYNGMSMLFYLLGRMLI